MTKEQIKKVVCDTIDKNRCDIIEIGESILKHPELGFKEEETSKIVKQVFNSLGISFVDNLAITGVKAQCHGRNHDLTVAILGEMDAVICPAHPQADPITGAAHSCGHNAQIASMLGAAIGLIAGGAMNELDGDVAFMAVPAEEFVELEYREKLKNQGKIKFFGGKQELIRLGAFDDIDMAMMVHSQANTPGKKVFLKGKSSGFIGKTVIYKGKEAHAGGAPHEGINALNAAMISIMSIHALRETFKDEDHIRVHPIITRGGDLVNIVPADVRMETYVRGRSIDAVVSANHKVNRALKAGAYAVGAEIEIREFPGYLPLNQNLLMSKLFEDNIRPFVGKENIVYGVDMIGSTDIGDLSTILPVIQPTIGGFLGAAHSRDFKIVDLEAAYIIPAKAMAMTIVDLLFDGADKGKKIKSSFKPQFDKNSYVNMWEQFL
ncbi:MAG TPA: amidohydrolase [Thermoanaerobacterales bacterium]|nr:amidohydrolase [Thermoanaerobacterales bacterium]